VEEFNQGVVHLQQAILLKDRINNQVTLAIREVLAQQELNQFKWHEHGAAGLHGVDVSLISFERS
jgi:hypothetical protein